MCYIHTHHPLALLMNHHEGNSDISYQRQYFKVFKDALNVVAHFIFNTIISSFVHKSSYCYSHRNGFVWGSVRLNIDPKPEFRKCFSWYVQDLPTRFKRLFICAQGIKTHRCRFNKHYIRYGFNTHLNQTRKLTCFYTFLIYGNHVILLGEGKRGKNNDFSANSDESMVCFTCSV